jgi:hypothetical protein
MGIQNKILSGIEYGFSRLKSQMRKGINYDHYEEFVLSAKNKIVGNIPDDLKKIIICNNPQSKKEAIITAQDAYTEAAVELSAIEKFQKQAIKRFTPNIENALTLLEHNAAKDNLYFTDKIYTEKLAELTLKAEQKMLDNLRTIIPDIGNIKITHIGLGSYSNAFRCEIFNTNGEKIIKDKVIKTFHEDLDFGPELFKQMNHVLSKFKSKKIEQYSIKQGRIIPRDKIEEQKFALKMIAGLNPQTPEALTYTKTLHGKYAEANAAEYIRHMSGHRLKEKEGLLLPDMVNLNEHAYSVMPYVEKQEETIFRQPFNFKRIGLEHTDANSNNMVSGVLIDIGGLYRVIDKNILGKLMQSEGYKYTTALKEAAQSSIVGNKTGTKILKQIYNAKPSERRELMETIRTEANKSKNELYKRDVLAALEEIERKKLVPIKRIFIS